MEVYNDWDSLFERFCIMTVDGGLSDFTAINYLMDKAPKELISKKFMKEQFNAAKKKVDAREEKENDNSKE